MKRNKTKTAKRNRRHKRIRSKVFGNASKPRLAVFKSNRYIYAQIIDDEKAITLAMIDTKKIAGKTLTLRAEAAGKAIAEKAKAKNVSKVVFDRGGFNYTGNIKAFADGARAGGLKF